MSKKLVFFLVALAFMVAAFASGASVSHAKVMELKFAANYKAIQPIGKIVQAWAAKVEEKSKGAMKIKLYFDAQLGAERDQLEAAQLGQIDACSASEGIMGAYVPEWKFLALGFLVQTVEGWFEFLETDLGRKFLTASEKVGLRVIYSGALGYRNPINSARPITRLADYKGLKVRTQQNPVQIATMKALGALPTPLPVTEVYTAMQTGVVQGTYADFGWFAVSKWYENGKYITGAPLFPCLTNILFSQKTWDKLNQAQRGIIVEAVTEAGQEGKELLVTDEDMSLVKVLKTGKVQINYLDSARFPEFTKALKPVYDDFLKDNPQAKPYVGYFLGKK